MMDYLKTCMQAPNDTLINLAKQTGYNITDLEFCRWLDEHDELAHFQKEFTSPKFISNEKGMFVQSAI